jgi:hypothetical protein
MGWAVYVALIRESINAVVGIVRRKEISMKTKKLVY